MLTIEAEIELWLQKFKNDDAFTESDAAELKSHLLDLMDKLKDAGLDDDEAFIIASKRIGDIKEFKEEFEQENIATIQTRRSAIILSGVLVYFFFYYFFNSFSKLLFIVFLKFHMIGEQAIFWTNKFLIFVHLIFILLFTSILLSEKIVMAYIEKVRFKPKHTVLLLLITFVLSICKIGLTSLAKSEIGANRSITSAFIHSYINFEFSFPLLFCIGFILIYYKYHSKAKI